MLWSTDCTAELKVVGIPRAVLGGGARAESLSCSQPSAQLPGSGAHADLRGSGLGPLCSLSYLGPLCGLKGLTSYWYLKNTPMFKYIDKSNSWSGNAVAMKNLSHRMSTSQTGTIYCFHMLWSPGPPTGGKCMENSSEHTGWSLFQQGLGDLDFSGPCLLPGKIKPMKGP